MVGESDSSSREGKQFRALAGTELIGWLVSREYDSRAKRWVVYLQVLALCLLAQVFLPAPKYVRVFLAVSLTSLGRDPFRVFFGK